jgi:hypothetical protein
VGEAIVWTGGRNGSLVLADTKCPAGPEGYILTSPDGAYVSIWTSAAGPIYPAGSYTGSAAFVGLYLGTAAVNGPTVYVSTSATVLIDLGGGSGTLDAELAPQGNQGDQAVHIKGSWHCS